MLAGISFAHQESSLVPQWTVADHFVMTASALAPFAMINKNGSEPWRQLAPDVRDEQCIASLSGHQQQCVEIARALAGGSNAILVDEPTALLAATERTKVLEALAQAAASARVVIWVTHDLNGALAYADRLVVLRDGAIACDEPKSAMSIARILDAMGINAPATHGRSPQARAERRGSIKSLLIRPGADQQIEVRCGEIVGLIGSARSRACDVLRGVVGLDSSPYLPASLDGAALPGNISAALQAGIVYMSRERSTEWIFDRQSVAFNIAAGSLHELASPFGMTDSRLYSHASEWAGRFDVKAPSLRMDIEGLSGGNKQKAVLARLAAMRPAFMLLDEPFSGVDRPTRARLFELLQSMAAAGTGIVIYSQESADLIASTDKICVMIAGALQMYRSDATQPADIEYAILNEPSSHA
jgi:ribose transport system ATP-binding protein